MSKILIASVFGMAEKTAQDMGFKDLIEAAEFFDNMICEHEWVKQDQVTKCKNCECEKASSG